MLKKSLHFHTHSTYRAPPKFLLNMANKKNFLHQNFISRSPALIRTWDRLYFVLITVSWRYMNFLPRKSIFFSLALRRPGCISVWLRHFKKRFTIFVVPILFWCLRWDLNVCCLDFVYHFYGVPTYIYNVKVNLFVCYTFARKSFEWNDF